MRGNREANGNAIGHGRRKRKEAPQKKGKNQSKEQRKDEREREKGELFDTAKAPKGHGL